jgi:hypothetical protein
MCVGKNDGICPDKNLKIYSLHNTAENLPVQRGHSNDWPIRTLQTHNKRFN